MIRRVRSNEDAAEDRDLRYRRGWSGPIWGSEQAIRGRGERVEIELRGNKEQMKRLES